jgi:hypothetical protein
MNPTINNPLTMNPIEFCNHHNSCREGLEFATKYQTMSEVWNECQNSSWMFWIIKRVCPLRQDQSVRLAIAFAETCLQYVKEGEDRPSKAIQAAKDWLENPCAETQQAANAASYAAYAASYASHAASHAAYAASHAAYAAADAAHAASYASHAAACDIIRNAIPNPFAP